MNNLVLGLHHITALASDPQKNVDFYTGILGLHLIKKTVNFDAPNVYHLYYGDDIGTPGTILTFFPYPGIDKGRKGKGQLTVTSFSIPEFSLAFWMDRLKKHNIPFEGPKNRFEETYLYFEDPEGLGLELVLNPNDSRTGYSKGPIPHQHAIKGFYGITLAEEGYEKTAHLLESSLNHKKIAEEENRFRYVSQNGFVDLVCCPDMLQGLPGAGTIHHVAFATKDDTTQVLAREKLIKNGINVTPVLDRQYFHSIYFREPGGVLFEIATLPPGFAIDEDPAHLGEALKLPPWEENHRKWIEKHLPELHAPLQHH